MSNLMPPDKSTKPLPRCKAILLCEKVIREAGTGNMSLINIVSRLVVPRLPAQILSIIAYLKLADGIGSYSLGAEVWNLTTGQSLAQGQGATIEFRDRLIPLDVTLPLPPVVLPTVGSYEVVLFADQQEIDRAKFTVELASGGPR